MKLHRRSRLCAALLAAAVMSIPFAPAIAWADGAEKSSNLKGWLGVDLVEMIGTADILGKMALVVLAIMSVATWTVIVFKFIHIRRARVQTDSFVRSCGHGTGQLHEAFKIAADYPDSPLAQILREAYMELEIENWYREGYNLDDAGRVDLAKIGIERVVERTITNEISNLESKLIFLATATSVCPFIGLFGTVWGIMIAFQGVGYSGSASLSALAPGVSTALLATVGGLFCAIPASVCYNSFSNQVRMMTYRMDAFGLELSNIIQKQILKHTV